MKIDHVQHQAQLRAQEYLNKKNKQREARDLAILAGIATSVILFLIANLILALPV